MLLWTSSIPVRMQYIVLARDPIFFLKTWQNPFLNHDGNIFSLMKLNPRLICQQGTDFLRAVPKLMKKIPTFTHLNITIFHLL